MASFDSYRVHGDEQVPAMSKTPSSSSEPLGSSYSEMLSNSLEIKIISSDEEQIVFDLIGVDGHCASNEGIAR